MTENFLYRAVMISLAVHTALLCVLYFNRITSADYNALRRNHVEISYNPVHKRPVDIKEHPIKPSQHLDLSNNQKFFSDGTIPVSLMKEKQALPFEMFNESKPQRMSVMELSHKISIMPIKSEKINNPVYAAYKDMVRDRIKERVYANYDKMEAGSVYLTFLVDSHGLLIQARIIPEKTNASQHLQDLALQSIREASPFPPFLKGMSLSEYSFNLEVRYQVSND